MNSADVHMDHKNEYESHLCKLELTYKNRFICSAVLYFYELCNISRLVRNKLYLG